MPNRSNVEIQAVTRDNMVYCSIVQSDLDSYDVSQVLIPRQNVADVIRQLEDVVADLKRHQDRLEQRRIMIESVKDKKKIHAIKAMRMLSMLNDGENRMLSLLDAKQIYEALVEGI